MSKLRVLILSGEFPPGPGGIGTHAYHVARELQRNGSEVMIISPQDYATEDEIRDFNSAQPFEITRLKHTSNSILEGISRLSVVKQKIHAWHPDILLATGERSAWIISYLSYFKKIPWVAVGHGSEFGSPLNFQKRFTRWAFNRATGVICVSQYTSSIMHKLGINPNIEKVIPNGADGDTYFPSSNVGDKAFLKDIGVDPDAHILLTVGNLTPRKGQEVVIRAMPLILKEFPRTEYLIAGLPTQLENHQKLADEMGIRDHIHFLGRKSNSELLHLYQACDLFMMTSRKLPDGDFEGFGISVIEAALCSKPAIVSKGSGLEEAVEHEKTGICVEENNPTETANAVIELLRNPVRRLEMGNNALQRARSGYTWEIVGKEYVAFLQECAKSRTARQ